MACRAEATELRKQCAPELERLGVRLACVVKEDLGTEIDDFISETEWGFPIVMDQPLSFYKAINGGEVSSWSVVGFLASMVNPFSQVHANFFSARMEPYKEKSNMTGEGFVTGGIYVVGVDGTAILAYSEEALGDHADVADVIAAAKIAAQR